MTLLFCDAVVTGYSMGYAFVEYRHEEDFTSAFYSTHRQFIDGAQIMVDFMRNKTVPGWIPRRLGGGIGGKKQSGQMRFGGRDCPFRALYTNVNRGQPSRDPKENRDAAPPSRRDAGRTHPEEKRDDRPREEKRSNRESHRSRSRHHSGSRRSRSRSQHRNQHRSRSQHRSEHRSRSQHRSEHRSGSQHRSEHRSHRRDNDHNTSRSRSHHHHERSRHYHHCSVCSTHKKKSKKCSNWGSNPRPSRY